MPKRRDALTFADLQLPRRKAIRFLERVQKQVLKAAKVHRVEIITRMGLMALDSPPSYRLELADGAVLLALDGVRHKALTDDEVCDIRWSKATMTGSEVFDLLMPLLLEDFEELTASSKPAS